MDAFLKQFMSGLKAVSTNTLLQAQLESLEYCWRSEVPPVDVRALSLKFVQAHNINPNTRSFAGLLRHGMVFALARAPDNLAFLDVLVPFVQRAGNDDLKAAARMFAQFGTRALAAVEPEDRTEDEWTAVATFADAINKKFGAAVMGQTQRGRRQHARVDSCERTLSSTCVFVSRHSPFLVSPLTLSCSIRCARACRGDRGEGREVHSGHSFHARARRQEARWRRRG